MPDREVAQDTNYPVVQMVLNSIADWVSRYREALGGMSDLGRCSADEVGQIAKDLGVSTFELREMVNKGPHAAVLLQKMLVALKVDAKELATRDPLVMRDLQRLCISCTDKVRCKSELAHGAAAEHFHEFCPNSITLDALFAEKNLAAKH